MKRIIVTAGTILTLFLSAGCFISSGNKTNIRASDELKVCRVDLDNDGIKEFIQVQDSLTEDSETIITVLTENKQELGSFSAPGRFAQMELVDLNDNGYKQIAVFSQMKNNYTNLVIYELKRSILSKIFTVGSYCGLNARFDSVLARIKVCKGENSPDISAGRFNNWDEWIWTGEYFLKEH